MPKAVIAAALTLSCLLTGAVGASVSPDHGERVFEPQSTERTWRFRVLLDEKEIGHHEFRVLAAEDGENVEIEAKFDVKFLFIKAYSYVHENRETWHNGCLEALQSRTEDNGETLAVSGAQADEGFRVDTGNGTTVLQTDCLQTFAYWNPAIVHAEQLLNAQTGELTPVEIVDRGPETLDVAGRPVDAHRYSITMDGDAIELWYRVEDRAWLALEAPAGGRTLRYELLYLPMQAEREQRLSTDDTPSAF